jgi:HSP20 family protein
MLSVRFPPLRELETEMDRMRSQFEQLWGQPANRPAMNPAGFPALNAWETDEAFYVEAEIPGLALEDLEIYISEGQALTIKGQRHEPELDRANWHRRERAYGTFERSLPLPGLVDQEQVEATLKLGVLTVKLPKAPQFRPRKIEVKSA